MNPMLRLTPFCSIALWFALFGSAEAKVLHSAMNGDWANPATWSLGKMPERGDTLMLYHAVSTTDSLALESGVTLIVTGVGQLCVGDVFELQNGSKLLNRGRLELGALRLKGLSVLRNYGRLRVQGFTQVFDSAQFFNGGHTHIGVGVLPCQVDAPADSASQDTLAKASPRLTQLAAAMAQDSSMSLQVYPNPVKDVLFIELAQAPQAAVQVRVFDLSGKLVSLLDSDKQLIKLSSSAWPSGTYFVEVRQGENRKLARVVK